MSATYFRYDGTVRNTVGEAVTGASIAVLTQPAVTTSEPGSPLATIYAAATSNTLTVTGAAWLAGTATLTFASVSSDVVVGSYISISSVVPSGYNGIVEVTAVSGLTVSYALSTNPGTYVSGGSAASSALPNPFTSDELGNFFFYTLAGIYTVQIYGSNLPNQLVLGDQNVVAGGGNGSVTSVGLTLPMELTVTGSPVSSSGTLAATWTNENANYIFAGPTSGGAATPGFRAAVAADFPAGVGTVTSVAHTLAVPAALLTKTVTGSPVTTSGTIADTIALATQTANLVFASATSGGSATPTFRALVAADLPGLTIQTVTVGLTSANILALDGTAITLVAAQGAGFTIVPLMIMVTVSGGSSTYTDAGGAVSFSVGSMSQALATNGVFTTPTSGQVQVTVLNFTGTSSSASTPDCDNAALTISKITHNFAVGNGTAKVKVQYLVLATD
jgi:hypothetical protein